MKVRLLVASLWLLGSISASGQLTGQFYLEKLSFARWEPVFLYYRITNNGWESISIAGPFDPEQPSCSGHAIKVSIDPVATPSCPLLGTQACVSNGPLSQPKLLRPGESYTERLLLNFDHEINALGDYWVEAKQSGMRNPTVKDAYTKLTFHVEEGTIAPGELQVWVNLLHSADRGKRMEAARTLASLAPPSLEETLLGFINNPEFRRYAALALHRLNTQRSLVTMAELMHGPVTSEQLEAAHYLARTDDQKWYPLLQDAAEKNARISSYPADAAELGGDKALPMLARLAKSQDREFTSGNAIMAMGSTGSRDAIPLLLDYLDSSDVNISGRAEYSLQLLTHRHVVQNGRNRDRQTEFTKWSQWWKREGANARIYKDSECGELTPLP